MKGIYGIWNDLCQSFDTGEDDAGWPSYEAALSACADGEVMALARQAVESSK